MRTLTDNDKKLLASHHYAVHRRVWVEDALGVMKNLSNTDGRDWLTGGSYNDDADTDVVSFSFKVWREVYDLSLAPLKATSKLNNEAGPLIDLARNIKYEWAITPMGAMPTNWRNGFEGVITDISWGSNPLTVTALDYGHVLQRLWVEEKTDYGQKGKLYQDVPTLTSSIYLTIELVSGDTLIIDAGKKDDDGNDIEEFVTVQTMIAGPLIDAGGTIYYNYELTAGLTKPHDEGAVVVTLMSLEDVLQDRILNVWTDLAGAYDSATALYVPASVNFAVRAGSIDPQSVMSALESLVGQIGWNIRYRYDESTQAWRLTLYEPDRNANTPQYTFGPEDYYDVKKLETSDQSIRNVFKTYYGAGENDYAKLVDAVDAGGNPVPGSSLGLYGRAPMQLTPNATGLINTAQEAVRLNAAADSDLAYPSAEQQIEVPAFPWVEVGDTYGFKANGVHYDSDQKWAISGYSHSWDENSDRTTLTVRGKPASGFHRWLSRAAGPGVAPPQLVPLSVDALALTTGVEHQGNTTWSYIRASWQAASGAQHYEVRYRKQSSESWTALQSVETVLKIAPLPGSVAYQVQARAVSSRGTPGAWSTAQAITTAASSAPPNITGLLGDFAGVDALFNWNAATIPNLDGYDISITVGGNTVHTTHISGPHYAYTLAQNTKDNTNPSATVEITVKTRNTDGLLSSGSSLSVSHPAPSAPTGLSATSDLGLIYIYLDIPSHNYTLRIDAGLQSNYSDATVKYQGKPTSGVTIATLQDGVTNYIRARFMNVFAQNGAWANANTTGRTITSDDFEGSLFDIVPSADHIRAADILAQLWDNDTSTYVVLTDNGYVTFEYPMQWFFDMVRFYVNQASVGYYVQAYHEDSGSWVNVLHSASSLGFSTEGWNVVKFDNGKKVVTKKLRIFFDPPASPDLRLSELKFNTITFADEILAQDFLATDSVRIVSADGSTEIKSGGVNAYDENSVRRATFGNVTGLPGVPGGNWFGIQGEAGAGLFFVGYPRYLNAGLSNVGAPSTTIASHDSAVVTFGQATLKNAFTVPTGKEYVYLAGLASLNPLQPILLGEFLAIVQAEDTDGVFHYPPLVAGNYLNLKTVVGARIYNPTGSSITYNTLQANLSWLAIEVDA